MKRLIFSQYGTYLIKNVDILVQVSKKNMFGKQNQNYFSLTKID